MHACSIMESIEVSPEMLTLIGPGQPGPNPWPADPIAFLISTGDPQRSAKVTILPAPSPTDLVPGAHAARLFLLVARAACERLLGRPLQLADGTTFFLPPEMRQIAIAICECDLPRSASTPYRLAKSIELLCEIIVGHRASNLARAPLGDGISLDQAGKIATARWLIDEHWDEKLTLSVIARRCGLNQTRLSRGFRALYDCSVSEALAERRLAEARSQLLATDLPVGVIGYRSGYLNNASFSRAFGRRFGLSPSDFRAGAVASQRVAA